MENQSSSGCKEEQKFHRRKFHLFPHPGDGTPDRIESISFTVRQSCQPPDWDFKDLKPDIYLTQEEITRLQAIHRANIEYRRQSAR